MPADTRCSVVFLDAGTLPCALPFEHLAPTVRERIAYQAFDTTAPADVAARVAQAEVVIVIAPSTPETEGMIGAEQLRLLPDDAVLVNVARGKLVDTDALVADAYRQLENVSALNLNMLFLGDGWFDLLFPHDAPDAPAPAPSSRPRRSGCSRARPPWRGTARRRRS